jgi:hypothetical protein
MDDPLLAPQVALGFPRPQVLTEIGASLRLAWDGFVQSARVVVEAVEQAGALIEENRDEIRSFWGAARQRSKSDWRYLLDLIDPFTAMTVVCALEAAERYHPAFREAAEDVLERGFLDEELIAAVRTGLAATDLPAPQQRQLNRGLDDLVAGDYELAVPMLMNPLEGAFWRLAEQRDVLKRDQSGNWKTVPAANGSAKKVRGVEAVISLDELDLPADFRRYMSALAYGGTGHPFRHGMADDGWKLRGLFLLAAMLGWLELAGVLNAAVEVRAAFVRQLHPPSDSAQLPAPREHVDVLAVTPATGAD